MNRKRTIGHLHCWHAYRGAIFMVIPDGHMVQKCCKCPATRTVHVEHSGGYGDEPA